MIGKFIVNENIYKLKTEKQNLNFMEAEEQFDVYGDLDDFDNAEQLKQVIKKKFHFLLF